MAWIELHNTVRDHKKIYALMDSLAITKQCAVGIVALFWTWALDFAPDGDITGFPSRAISDAVQWRKSADKLLAALISCGWLDHNEGRLCIHDWDVYTWRYFDKMEQTREQTKRRVNDYRKRKKALQCNDEVTDEALPVTQCNAPTVPNLTIYTPYSPPRGTDDVTSSESLTVKTASGTGKTVDHSTTLTEQRFSEFWKAYPKKVGKAAAYRAFSRIKPSAELHGNILSAIEMARASDQWKRDNGQYIPHPTTWLNQGRWDDEVEQEEERYKPL